jgi:hypothetical protein
MIFLLEYDREQGKLLKIRSFPEHDRKFAQRERLQRELELTRSGVFREVVLLEAEDQKALERTHRRYFRTAAEILESHPDLPETLSE